jgi:LEA14-like dessication related protein
MQNPILGTAITMSAVLLFGMMMSCSTVPKDFEMPKVSISDITPKDMTLMEQRFEVQLRIQNPNTFALGINGARFNIELNGKKFGYGMSGQNVTIPRFSSEVISGELITGLGSILRQVRGLSSGVAKVQYSLKGTIFAESPRIFTADFEDAGDIDLSFEPADEK